MAPDLATYSPLVHAVFDAPGEENQRIPYSLADQGPLHTGGISETFLNLLRLAKGRLGVTAVLDLLECAAVRQRFGFAEGDLPVLRHWVTETRIHWGRDAAHRATFGQPATDAHTWRAGLQRLLLGHAMSDDDQRLFQGILPFPDIEGSIAQTLGQFAGFIEQLTRTITQLEQQYSPSDWVPVLLAVVDAFFSAESNQEEELKQLRRRLDELRRPALAAGIAEPIDLALLLDPLTAALDEDLHGAGFLTGGVTFCALKPMRSIPFRVICLLGMNDGAFPRVSPHLSLDLMAADPRLGDRSTRDDDRYLFLETVISARDRLHLSHVGQSQRDNRPIPPSVVVSEVFDHLDEVFAPAESAEKISEAALIVRHRLHAFSPAYFTSDPGSALFSYSSENSATATHALAARLDALPFLPQALPEPGPERRQVTLKQLADFLCHPARFLLRERLQIELPRSTETLDDDEPLSLDARESYNLKQDLVAWRLKGGDSAAFGAVLTAEGRLAPGQPGVMEFRDLRDAADQFRNRLGEIHPGAPVRVDLALGDFQLTGRLVPQRNAGLLHYRCATLKAADRLRLWVEHLAWNLTALSESSLVTSTLVAEDVRLVFRPVPGASRYLQALLDLYWRGLQSPLRFFPRTALAFIEAERKAAAGGSRSKKTPLEIARPHWIGSELSSMPAEGDDAWFRLCFRQEADPLTDEFQSLARAVFGPLLDHCGEAS